MSAGAVLGSPAEVKREMVLGQTDGFRYIGFQPPLTEDELASLPVPALFVGTDDSFHDSFVYREIHPDGSMQLGYDSTIVFCEPENIPSYEPENSIFVGYAKDVARHLGNVSLDPAVRYVGPGSMFSDENMGADTEI